MKTRTKKTVIGTATCHCCGREIPVKQNELGTLDMSCQWCDLPLYTKFGTESHKRLMERVTLRITGQEPANPEAVPVPSIETKPARAARSAFDLLGVGRA
jgi:transcription elongation factor Elf1